MGSGSMDADVFTAGQGDSGDVDFKPAPGSFPGEDFDVLSPSVASRCVDLEVVSQGVLKALALRGHRDPSRSFDR